MNIEKLLEELKATFSHIRVLIQDTEPTGFMLDSVDEYCENSTKKINAFLELYRAEKAKQTNIFEQ